MQGGTSPLMLAASAAAVDTTRALVRCA